MASPSVFLLLRSGDDWWDEVNNSVLWQDRIFHTLAVLYGLMFAVALVISSSLIFDFRSLIFVFRWSIDEIQPEVRLGPTVQSDKIQLLIPVID
ncbi:hypothetical protein ZIOFF_029572 [Zingiber officinale]|uniref:THH1/TOM1/TOM3 domain-containing protein n=1 Tax=Zingiber officinale TaxID=94328 RepID=A0A8J5H1R6_ZINOF|nr:hypothetical protein ZIOFF_029572 [Zingiber officinale]